MCVILLVHIRWSEGRGTYHDNNGTYNGTYHDLMALIMALTMTATSTPIEASSMDVKVCTPAAVRRVHVCVYVCVFVCVYVCVCVCV